jgi:hypothetical protein
LGAFTIAGDRRLGFGFGDGGLVVTIGGGSFRQNRTVCRRPVRDGLDPGQLSGGADFGHRKQGPDCGLAEFHQLIEKDPGRTVERGFSFRLIFFLLLIPAIIVVVLGFYLGGAIIGFELTDFDTRSRATGCFIPFKSAGRQP